MKTIPLLGVCVLIIAVQPVWAGWVQDATGVRRADENRMHRSVVSDGVVGAIVACQDTAGDGYDNCARRVDASGAVQCSGNGTAVFGDTSRIGVRGFDLERPDSLRSIRKWGSGLRLFIGYGQPALDYMNSELSAYQQGLKIDHAWDFGLALYAHYQRLLLEIEGGFVQSEQVDYVGGELLLADANVSVWARYRLNDFLDRIVPIRFDLIPGASIGYVWGYMSENVGKAGWEKILTGSSLSESVGVILSLPITGLGDTYQGLEEGKKGYVMDIIFDYRYLFWKIPDATPQDQLNLHGEPELDFSGHYFGIGVIMGDR